MPIFLFVKYSLCILILFSRILCYHQKISHLPLKLLSSRDPLLSFGQIIQEMNYLQKFMPHLMKSISLRHLLRELKILANFQKQRNTSMKLY